LLYLFIVNSQGPCTSATTRMVLEAAMHVRRHALEIGAPEMADH